MKESTWPLSRACMGGIEAESRADQPVLRRKLRQMNSSNRGLKGRHRVPRPGRNGWQAPQGPSLGGQGLTGGALPLHRHQARQEPRRVPRRLQGEAPARRGGSEFNQAVAALGLRRAGCRCPLRRYFFDARHHHPAEARLALGTIRDLFAIEAGLVGAPRAIVRETRRPRLPPAGPGAVRLDPGTSPVDPAHEPRQSAHLRGQRARLLLPLPRSPRAADAQQPLRARVVGRSWAGRHDCSPGPRAAFTRPPRCSPSSEPACSRASTPGVPRGRPHALGDHRVNKCMGSLRSPGASREGRDRDVGGHVTRPGRGGEMLFGEWDTVRASPSSSRCRSDADADADTHTDFRHQIAGDCWGLP